MAFGPENFQIIVKLGDPSLPLSEPVYLIDFISIFLEARNRIFPETGREVVEMYSKGQSVKEIANFHQCSKNKIIKYLKENGVTLREVHHSPQEQGRLKRGKPNHRAIYGFCYFEGAMTPDPKEFSTLKLIHRLWDSEKTIHQIAKDLNSRKIPSRNGKSWSWAAVRGIVQRFENEEVILKKEGEYELK